MSKHLCSDNCEVLEAGRYFVAAKIKGFECDFVVGEDPEQDFLLKELHAREVCSFVKGGGDSVQRTSQIVKKIFKFADFAVRKKD